MFEKGSRHLLWIVCKGGEKVCLWVPTRLEGYENGRHRMVTDHKTLSVPKPETEVFSRAR